VDASAVELAERVAEDLFEELSQDHESQIPRRRHSFTIERSMVSMKTSEVSSSRLKGSLYWPPREAERGQEVQVHVAVGREKAGVCWVLKSPSITGYQTL